MNIENIISLTCYVSGLLIGILYLFNILVCILHYGKKLVKRTYCIQYLSFLETLATLYVIIILLVCMMRYGNKLISILDIQSIDILSYQSELYDWLKSNYLVSVPTIIECLCINVVYLFVSVFLLKTILNIYLIVLKTIFKIYLIILKTILNMYLIFFKTIFTPLKI